jgi:hypothetical protein
VSLSPSEKRSALRAEGCIRLEDLYTAGIKPEVLDDLENGRLDQPVDLLLRVACALGVTPGIIARRAGRIDRES